MATERVTERSDGVTNERVVERDAGTRVVERRGGGGMGLILGLVALVAIAAIVLLVLSNRQSPTDAAVEDAAQSVAGAAESVGNAAERAADSVAPN